ncbi:Uncharacterised protein [Klebsiella pneumoniae]|nr:Uncharacterised protein [Klebsiella pneumoniae]
MTISEPVRSLDTHELMPGDIYPHPAVGGIYSLSHREVCSLFSDHIMYICSALVILLLVFIAGVFFRKIMTSSVERKRNTIQSQKHRANRNTSIFPYVWKARPARMSPPCPLLPPVLSAKQKICISPASIAATALTTCLPGPCRLSFLLTGSSAHGFSRQPAGLNVRIGLNIR